MDNTRKEKDNSNYVDLRKKLKQSEESRKWYEKELRIKTEEAESLKTAIKDLKEIAKLNEQLMEKSFEVSINDGTENDMKDLVNVKKDKQQKRINIKTRKFIKILGTKTSK